MAMTFSDVWEYDIPLRRIFRDWVLRPVARFFTPRDLSAAFVAEADMELGVEPELYDIYERPADAIDAGVNSYFAWFEARKNRPGFSFASVICGMNIPRVYTKEKIATPGDPAGEFDWRVHSAPGMDEAEFKAIFFGEDSSQRTPALISKFCSALDIKLTDLYPFGTQPPFEVIEAALHRNRQSQIGDDLATQLLTQVCQHADVMGEQTAKYGMATNKAMMTMIEKLYVRSKHDEGRDFKTPYDVFEHLAKKIEIAASFVQTAPNKEWRQFEIRSEDRAKLGQDQPYFFELEGKLIFHIPRVDVDAEGFSLCEAKQLSGQCLKAISNWLGAPQTTNYLKAEAMRRYIEGKGYGIRSPIMRPAARTVFAA